jgi:protein-disulfide isomerase
MKAGLAIVAAALAGLLVGFYVGQRSAQPGDDVTARLEAIQQEIAELKSARPVAPTPPPRRRTGPDPDEIHQVKIDDSPVRGAEDARVTIVEFSDFQCPYCGRVGPTLERLLEEYPDELRIVYKHLPLSFHERALPAAKASVAAGEQGRFWEFHDALFENQKELTDEKFMEIAASLGLDTEQFQRDYQSVETATRVAQDMNEARRLGVTGTPGFFVNGRFLSGARPYESFEAMVDAALEGDA